MKIYGYEIGGSDIEDIVPNELAEITLVVNAEELTKLVVQTVGLRMLSRSLNATSKAAPDLALDIDLKNATVGNWPLCKTLHNGCDWHGSQPAGESPAIAL